MTARSKGNPFAQSPKYWKLTFEVPAAAAGTADESFDDIALAVSAFAINDGSDMWVYELLFGAPPDMEEISRRLIVLSALHELPVPRTQTQVIEQQDWLAKVARDFPPLSIGRFYVHGKHVQNVPPGAIDIQVDAGAAFGSGEHGTTRCCLEALDWLAKRRDCAKILDMGCGSGILAIAAAKLWRVDVLAVDIDPVAVRVTEENARINREQSRITAAVSDGYALDRIKKNGPYDLILSNILARPLIAFAPDLAKHLATGGVAVLSGLLTSQETQVLSAHAMQGVKLQKRFVHEEWCTLVIGR